jgi:hypothetical protein
METPEKLQNRAWLLTLGAELWYPYVDRIERMKIVDILTVEFARAKAAGEPLIKERARLENLGIRIVDVPVHPETPTDTELKENAPFLHDKSLCESLANDTCPSVDSAPVHSAAEHSSQVQEKTGAPQTEGVNTGLRKVLHQQHELVHSKELSKGVTNVRREIRHQWSFSPVPPALKDAVYEEFRQGWSKSKLAREFQLNRRTIIRICREREARER